MPTRKPSARTRRESQARRAEQGYSTGPVTVTQRWTLNAGDPCRIKGRRGQWFTYCYHRVHPETGETTTTLYGGRTGSGQFTTTTTDKLARSTRGYVKS